MTLQCASASCGPSLAGRAGKFDQFGVNFTVELLVDSDVIRPYGKIGGKIVIETIFPIKHNGIRIQFEGVCALRYATKFENRTIFHQGRESILKGTQPNIFGYQESPVRHIILSDGSKDSYHQYPSDLSCMFNNGTISHLIEPGTVTYPFTLEIPGNGSLPAPFKLPLGKLVYRLAVYLKSTNHYNVQVEVAEKIMRFTGFHNLLDNVEVLQPISLTNCYKKSIFSRINVVEVEFSTSMAGCLPGESIPFILYVKNPKCISLRATVQLVKQIKYDASGRGRDSTKKVFDVLNVMEKDGEEQPELAWVDNLFVGDNAEPSFIAHVMYNVTYSIQYNVEIVDHGNVKGEAPIFIGTTRDPVQTLMSNANGDVPFLSGGLGRRGSACSSLSVRSTISTASTTCSLPPAYSQLSSRFPSLETLPPAYDQLELLENLQGGLSIAVPNVLSPADDERTDVGIKEEEGEAAEVKE